MNPALETLILKFIEEKGKVRLRDIAERLGLSTHNATDRRAMQRVLAKLIKQQLIQAEGNARSRAYLPLVAVKDEPILKDIFITETSVKLLHSVSKPLHTRKPVGYNPNFLTGYKPNQTKYLSDALQKELHAIGNTEINLRPAGTYARTIFNRLLIDLSWNSSRLEGNTYSLLETKRLIEFGKNAPGKDPAETQMILNHKDAIEYIIESAHEKKITAHEIRSIHALLSDNLLGDSSASGRLREIAVGISGTTYLPLENTHLLKEYFDLFIKKLNLIKNPFEQSFFSLVHLSYLQAFEDVNKRTSRLVANIPLIKQNLKPLSFTDIDQKDYAPSLLGIYEKNDPSLLRELYVWAYKRSAERYSALQQAMGEPNLLKIKYRDIIQKIIRTIILKKVSGSRIVTTIKNLLAREKIIEPEFTQLFQIIEREIVNLHDGNIARFKIRPSEFQQWIKIK